MAKERVAGKTLKIRKRSLFFEKISLFTPTKYRVGSGIGTASSIKKAVTVFVIVRLSPVRRRDPAISLDL